MSKIIQLKHLKVFYPIRGGFWNRVVKYVKAVNDISFSINTGETYGLVGESGSGKSTLGRAIVGLQKITSGKVYYKGHDVTTKHERKALKYNHDVQMIFQDAASSLNPQKRIKDIIDQPLINFTNLNKEQIHQHIGNILKIVGLHASDMYKYPFQFSGGQRQRIDIARAIITHPKLIVADEPVSALDLSVQAQVLNFMKKIQKRFNISYLFISHDLGVIRHMCDNIAIMNHGHLLEIGTRDDIYNRPLHIYTRRLLSAIPEIDVLHREGHRQHRLKVEKEFQDDKDFYYQKNGDPFPMTKVSPTHWVALPKDRVAKLEQKLKGEA